MEEQTCVSPSAPVSQLAPLVVFEIDAAPVMDGVTADVGRHSILYSQAHELVSTLPA